MTDEQSEILVDRQEVEISTIPERIASRDVADVPGRRKVHLSGRVLEINYRDGTAELWDQLGHEVVVQFDDDQLPLIDAARRQFVTIGASTGTEPDRQLESVKLDSIAVDTFHGSFWHQAAPDEVAASQDCTPLAPAGDLSATFWEDDDIDDFLDTVRRWRSES